MALIATVLSVFRAVVTIFLTALPGFVAGFTGVFDQEFLQPLSRFLLGFLTPALVFHTLATRLTIGMLGKLWPLVLWSCAQMAVGLALASLLSRALGIRAPGSKVLPLLLQLAMSFQNIGAFNFPLLQTLCGTPGLFDSESQQCFDDGMLMIFVYKIPWDIMLWTWGYSRLMALGGREAKAESASPSSSSDGQPGERELSKADSATDEAKVREPMLQGRVRRVGLAVARAAASCNPIIWALLLGVPIGITPGLRSLVFGPATPLGPLGDALKGMSTPVPGMGLQILSGTLGCALRDFWTPAHQGGAGPAARPATQRAWLATVVAGKLVLLPAAGFLLFSSFGRFHACQAGESVVCPLVPEVPREAEELASAVLPWLTKHFWPSDRLFRTVLVMEWSAPSFLNLVVICHRAALDKAIIESVAMLYLVMYAATVLTTTFWVGAGLALL